MIKCDYANIPVFLCNTRISVRFLLDSLSEIVYINHNEQMFNCSSRKLSEGRKNANNLFRRVCAVESSTAGMNLWQVMRS